MPTGTLTLLMFATGLGLAAVGAGLAHAYTQVRRFPYDPNAANDAPPAALVPLLSKFVLASRVCLAAGLALIAVSLLAPRAAGVRDVGAVPISLYYAAALALLLIILTYNVLHHRVKALLAGPADGHPDTERIVRVHANFTEYAPTGIALLILLEWAAAPAVIVHAGGLAFVLGRYVHAWGMTRAALSLGRIIGIQLTLFALAFMTAAAAVMFFTSVT